MVPVASPFFRLARPIVVIDEMRLGKGARNRRNRAESETPKPLKRRGGEIAVIAVIARDRRDRNPRSLKHRGTENAEVKQQLPKLGKESK